MRDGSTPGTVAHCARWFVTRHQSGKIDARDTFRP
jgi:hypothetical protein